MCIGLIGGMDRLRRDYLDVAAGSGCEMKIFTGKERHIGEKLGQPDMLILFTNKVSHAARREVMAHARSKNIPVRMVHSCGVSTLRQVLESD